MSNKKTTAVDWLLQQFDEEKTPRQWEDVYKQAKQMDKEQSIEDMNKMQIIKDVDFDGNVTFIFNPEQYYKETYGE